MALATCSNPRDGFPLSVVQLAREYITAVTGTVLSSSGNEANKDANCDLMGTRKERVRLGERAEEAK